MGRKPSSKRLPQLEPPTASSSFALVLSRSQVLVGMIAVLLAGAAFRLVAIDRLPPGLSHDEAYIGVTALEVWLQGRREVFFEIYNGIEPLIVYWQALYLRLFGITPVAMRLVSVTSGLLIIPLTYALTNRLLAFDLGPRMARVGALLAALGISLSFWAVFISRLALRAVTLPLLILPAFYCLWLGLTDNHSVSGRRLIYFVLGGVWLGAGMYTYLSSRFLPFIPLLFFIYWALRGQVRREHWLGMALFFAFWGLVFAPLGLYYLNHPEVFGRRAGQVLNIPLALAGDPRPLLDDTLHTLGMFSVVGAKTSRYGLAGRPLFDPLGAILFFAGLVVALVRLRRPARQSAPYAFLLIWWLVMLVPDFITGESPHFLRTVGALPPTYILWAVGILSIGTWLMPRAPVAVRRLALPVLVVYLVASGWFTVRDYFGRWASDAEAREIYGADFTEVARYLQASQDLAGPVPISAAYYRDWDRFRLDLLMHHSPPFVVWFDGPQTLLLPPPGTGLNPPYIFPRSAPPHPYWLEFLEPEVLGDEISVYRLKSDATLDLEARLDVVIDGSETASPSGTLQLLGYQLEGDAQAGEVLRLLLHWQPLQDVPGDPDYAFFAHLRDQQGYTWAQVDANGYAVVDWQPQVQVLQWLELPLPPDLPPLSYDLVLGLEDRGVGQPLGTPIEIGTITPSIANTFPSPDDFIVPNASDVSAGAWFTLRGYSLTPRFLQPGSSTHVTLYWQAQLAPDADNTLALWLVNQSGDLFPLEDREPLGGDYPTSRWSAGQWVRDRFDMTLPPDLPSGLYEVFVGWRDPSGARLPVRDEAGITLGEIFVADR